MTPEQQATIFSASQWQLDFNSMTEYVRSGDTTAAMANYGHMFTTPSYLEDAGLGLFSGIGLGEVASLLRAPVKVLEDAPKGPLWSSTKSKSAVENAFGHWSKHKGEFPELQNAKQYAEKAKDFLTNPPKGSLTKVNSRGDTLRYDPGTNTFGVLSKDGAPRTMFRPKDGMDYWNRR